MTRLREGFLSDESMMKECMLHQPVPMNRLDLLPRPMENKSGLYYRPLKETKIIARPQSAGVMLEATERLTGNNLKADYMIALKEAPKIVKVPTYPNTLPDTQGIPVAPNVGNAYSIATVAYDALASQAGIPISLSSGMSASVPPPPVTLSEGDTATISELDVAELTAGMSEEERYSYLEGERIAALTEIQEGVETGILVRPPPVVSRAAPPRVPQRPRPPIRTLQPDVMEARRPIGRRPITRQEPRPVPREIRQIM